MSGSDLPILILTVDRQGFREASAIYTHTPSVGCRCQRPTRSPVPRFVTVLGQTRQAARAWRPLPEARLDASSSSVARIVDQQFSHSALQGDEVDDQRTGAELSWLGVVAGRLEDFLWALDSSSRQTS